MTQQQEQNFAIQRVADTNIQETAAASRAASAVALVQARCVMALQRPRDWETVRVKLLKECQRPGFAEAAVYRKPMGGGKKIEDVSIRFAEAAMRYAGNLDVKSETVHEDESSITVQVSAIDLETNAGSETSVRIQKTVERRSSAGRVVLSKRVNSDGENVFIVVATEDEMVGKVNSFVSKARRNLIQQFIPGDIVEECKLECQSVYADKTAKDPDTARRRMFDDFARYDVTPAQIREYLGHSNPPTVKELEELRGLHAALATGETTWSAIVDTDRSELKTKQASTMEALKSQQAQPVAAPTPAARKTPSAPVNEAPLPRGDVEDALQRMRDCPLEDLGHLAAELRNVFSWTDDEKAKMRSAFSARRKPNKPASPEPDPENDGRAG